MIGPQRYFIHRWNQDQTTASICSVCGQTVCNEWFLARAQEYEDQHECPSGAIDLWNLRTGSNARSQQPPSQAPSNSPERQY